MHNKLININYRPLVCSLILFMIVIGAPKAQANSNQLKNNELRKSTFPIQRNARVVEDIVIVKRHATISKANDYSWQEKLNEIKSLNIQPMFKDLELKYPQLSDVQIIQLPSGSNVYDVAEKLQEDPEVIWAEPLYIYKSSYQPNDPGRNVQWYLDNIKANEAWEELLENNEVALNDTNVLIAVIDTGVDTDHPDLKQNIWQNPNEIPNNGVDDDDNGYIDDIVGWDFGNSDNDPKPSDIAGTQTKWHGTWVSGVASAVTDNRLGISAPAYNAKIMAIKTTLDTDPEQGVAYWPAGIVYASENGADIINCSFSGTYPSNLGKLVVDIAMNNGSLVVAAAANAGNDSLHYPASYRRVLSVAATDEDDKKADFSQYNSMVDISAPGVRMHTTGADRLYDDVQGTSFSCPLVASVAALVKGIHPEYTFEQVREQVRVTADYIDDINPQYKNELGRGRLNAYRAVTEKTPSIRIADIYIDDKETGNGDAIAGQNEKFNIVLKLKNFLMPASNVQLTLSTNHSDITIEKSTSTIGSISTLDSLTNESDPFILQVDDNLTGLKEATFTLKIEADNYEDLDYFIIELNQGYTVKGGNVSLTLSNDGNLGYLDFSDNKQGVGFTYASFGSLLYEGAFLAGVSRNKVSDEARGANDQDDDFTPAVGAQIIVEEPGDFGDMEGQVIFTDSKSNNPIYLWVRQTAYAFKDAPDNDYVILQYELTNLSNSKIEGLFVGHYFDWDLRSAAYNKSNFSKEVDAGYIYDSAGYGYGGCQVLSSLGMTAYKSIHHDEELYPYASFSDSLKWEYLSGGVQQPKYTEASDYSHIVGTGPYNIAADDTVIVGFAIIGAHELKDFKENAKAAQTKWNSLHGEAPSRDSNASISLSQNYPNPFPTSQNNSTNIEFGLSETARVELKIFNILGQEVIQLLDAEMDAGVHTIEWNGSNKYGNDTPSGVYFCQLKSGSKDITKKIVIIR